jgi:hypothetical protein
MTSSECSNFPKTACHFDYKQRTVALTAAIEPANAVFTVIDVSFYFPSNLFKINSKDIKIISLI